LGGAEDGEASKSEAQKADRMPVADICQKAETSPATNFNWKRYESMQPPELRRLKEPRVSCGCSHAMMEIGASHSYKADYELRARFGGACEDCRSKIEQQRPLTPPSPADRLA